MGIYYWIISGELAERSKATVSKIVILLVGIEGSNPSLSAIFILNAPNHSVKQRTTLQASLASCSFFFTLGALIAEKIRKSA